MPGFNIRSAAHLSGLSEHILRAWERRYHAVQPERSEGGHRLYSPSDVEKLKLLAALVSRGHAIRTVATLPFEKLVVLARDSVRADTRAPHPAAERAAPFVHGALGIIEALRRHDFDAIDRLLTRSRLELSCREFVLNVAAPLLTDVGRLVATGVLDVSQEHAFSAVLRNHLAEFLALVQRAHPVQSQATFAFATPEGDLHEFGILLSALLAGVRGARFRYLGPNLPAESLARAMLELGTRTLVLGTTPSAHFSGADGLEPYLSRLADALPAAQLRKLEVWVGGEGRFKPGRRFATKRFATLAEFDAAVLKSSAHTKPKEHP